MILLPVHNLSLTFFSLAQACFKNLAVSMFVDSVAC